MDGWMVCVVDGKKKHTIPLSIPLPQLRIPLFILPLHFRTAAPKRGAKVIRRQISLVMAVRMVVVDAGVGLVGATLKLADFLVLAFVETGLLALLDDAVVEVDAGGEGAGDGGDEGCDYEALLWGVSGGGVSGRKRLLGLALS